MYGTHCEHNSLFHHQFSITISTYPYKDVCGIERTPVHILRDMGGMSNNNNKIQINNSLCYFTIRVVYIQLIKARDIPYIDEGLLVWIIPSTYLSHEVVI